MDMNVLVGGAVCVNDDAAAGPTVALEIMGGADEDGMADGEAVAATAELDEATGCAMAVRPDAAATHTHAHTHTHTHIHTHTHRHT